MNSDGASEPCPSGTMRTPSIVISSPVFLMYCVGRDQPGETVAERQPAGAQRALAAGRQRRAVHVLRAARHRVAGENVLGDRMSMKASGAMIFTLPERTSASSTTPRTPPKWSAWLWVADHRHHRLGALQRVHRQLEAGAAIGAVSMVSITIQPVWPSTSVMPAMS